MAGIRKYRNKVTSGENKHLYGIWNKMRYRCCNESEPRYKDYGGRGISVCDEWLNDFDAFADWAKENGYAIGLTIDRIDNDGDYSPSNCRWSTRKEQNRNKRDTILVTHNGQRKPLVEWCEELGLPYDAIHNRIISMGWDAEKALTTPLANQKKSFAQTCREHNINPKIVYTRVNRLGWSLDEALNTPTMKRGEDGVRTGLRKQYAVCAVCGCNFEKNTGKQKYCSEKCHLASKRVSFKRKAVNS